MIAGCRRFVGADGGAECLGGDRLDHILFRVLLRKVFRQRFSGLGECRFQKIFESGIVKGAVLDDPQNRRHHFRRRNERLGRYVEKPLGFSAALGQYGQRGEGFFTRSGAKLFGDLLLHHHQQASAHRIFQSTQNDMRRDVVGEVGDQMVRPLYQAPRLPVTQNISATEFQLPMTDGGFETPAQMFTKVSVHLESGDILFLDQFFGQIT